MATFRKTRQRVSTLETVIHHYIQDEMPERTSTRTFYLPWLNNYIRPKWGSYDMRRIQPFAVEQWLKTLHLAPKSKAHIRSLMRILFSSAMRYGFIPVTQNPMSLVRVPGCTKREREPRVLTADECRSILGYLNDPWRTMVLVAMCLGLRVSEILGLKWSDFDFSRNMVLVQRAWVVGKIGDVKTRYSRKQMPLDASLVVALISYPGQYECCEWVFANPDTSRPWWAHHIQHERIGPAAVKANLGTGIGWHTFRHSYSSMLRNLGVDVKVQQESQRCGCGCRASYDGQAVRGFFIVTLHSVEYLSGGGPMCAQFSRRGFLKAITAAATAIPLQTLGGSAAEGLSLEEGSTVPMNATRIVDIHVHFEENNPNFLRDLLKVADRVNLTACLLTPYSQRLQVAEAAKRYPRQIVPFGFVDLDAPDVLAQVKDFHALGYRGLGELEFVKKPYTDPSYQPVYELANHYGWVLMFHTGIVLRRSIDQPEDVASYRMRAFHLEEVARRFPKLTVIGAHCGNPEYEWAAEVARWNPNVFFDLSGSTLTKMSARLEDFKKLFWWSGQGEWKTATPANDPSAYIKLVFGSDAGLDGIETVVNQYRAFFRACDVPAGTQQMILGGTLAQILRL